MQSEEKKTPVQRKRRTRGVPFGLVTLLVVLALISGGVAGYVGGAKFSQTAKKLKEAQAAIADYEMTLMEMYSDEFDRAAAGSDADVTAALGSGDFGIVDASEPIVVAEFDGGTVMSDEAIAEYETSLASYAIGGADVTQNAAAILDTALETLVGEKVAYLKAVEKGYTTLTDDDRAKIADKAQAQFDETVNFYIDIVREEGMSDEDAYHAAVNYLAETEDYTIDGVTDEIEAIWWQQKLYDEIIADVTVTSDEITTAYNEQVAAQEAQFTSDPEQFEYALLGGDMILYYPAGYRTVKHILFELDADSQVRANEINAALSTETDQAKLDELNAELDQLYTPVEEEAQVVYGRLQGGESFDELMLAESDDEELNGGAFSRTGYYVSVNSVMWSDKFVSACMALANPGDLSAPVRTEGGVHILLFVANVQPGAVPLSQVNAEMTESTLESARFEAYQAALQSWVNAANPKYYPERIIEQE